MRNSESKTYEAALELTSRIVVSTTVILITTATSVMIQGITNDGRHCHVGGRRTHGSAPFSEDIPFLHLEHGMKGLGIALFFLSLLVVGMGALYYPGIQRPIPTHPPKKGREILKLSAKQEKSLDEANKALLEKRLSDAQRLLEPLRGFSDLRVRLSLAELDGNTQRFSTEQIHALEKEVRADRGLVLVFQLARITERAGDHPRAKAYLQELARVSYLPPALQTPVNTQLASISASLGDHSLVIQITPKLLQAQPASEELLSLFLGSLRASKTKVSPRFLFEIVDRHHGSHFKCQLLLSKYLFDVGLKEEGIRRLEICHTLAPVDTFIMSQLYVFYRQSKQWDRALDMLQRCFDLEHVFPKQAMVAKASFEAAREAAKLQKPQQAFFFLRFALLRDRSLLESGGETTFTAVSDLIQSKGNEEERAVLAVFWRFMNGEPREALSAALSLGPKLKDHLLVRDLGTIQKACKGILEGESAYQRYLQELHVQRKPPPRIAPPPVAVVATLTAVGKPATTTVSIASPTAASEVLESTGDPKVDAILKEAQVFSENSAFQWQAADRLMLLQAWETAERLMKKRVEQDHKDWQARYRLGVIAFHFQRLEEANEHLSEALRLEPNDGKSRVKLARMMLQRGELPQAYEEAKTALTKDPNLSEAYYVMGQVLFNRGRPDEAIKEIDQGLQLEIDATSETFSLLSTLRAEIKNNR